MTTPDSFDMTTLKTEFRGIVAPISIDRRARKPLHQQIYDSFRRRIIQRELRAGELVPSSRRLARELRVSRLPVLNAYAQLLAEGYFESRVGAGTFIATSLPAQHQSLGAAAARIDHTSRRISSRAAALPPYERPLWAGSLGPFQIGQPDLHSFPMDIWSRLIARYSRRVQVKGLQYGDPMGLPELRETLPKLRNDQQLTARAAKESLWLSPLSASYVGNRRVGASYSASATRERIRFLPRFGNSKGYARSRVEKKTAPLDRLGFGGFRTLFGMLSAQTKSEV